MVRVGGERDGDADADAMAMVTEDGDATHKAWRWAVGSWGDSVSRAPTLAA